MTNVMMQLQPYMPYNVRRACESKDYRYLAIHFDQDHAHLFDKETGKALD